MHGNKHVTKGDNQMARDKLLSYSSGKGTLKPGYTSTPHQRGEDYRGTNPRVDKVTEQMVLTYLLVGA